MEDNNQEEAKRQLHKLLREYQGNSGMAGFVCSRPVELMPQGEQERIINGFCTSENLKILEISRRKLDLARSIDLDDSEKNKLDQAIPILDGLVDIFKSYNSSNISTNELRKRVRSLLDRPIPDTKDGLIDSLSKQIEAIEFLSSQEVSNKDSWDQMIDCAQLHDVLSRVVKICLALQGDSESSVVDERMRPGAIGDTAKLAKTKIDFLEAYFKGDINSGLLQDEFKSMSVELQKIWAES